MDREEELAFIPKGKKILRPGGYAGVYNPYIEAARAVYQEMEKNGCKEVEAFEMLRVDLDVKRVGTRTSTRVWHTGYIGMGRRF